MDSSWALPTATPAEVGMNGERLAVIDDIVTQAIEQKLTPGAVVLVGHAGRVVYHKAFGMRCVEPALLPMTLDTLFDVASLTKPLVTAPLLMMLVEQGLVKLTATVAQYLPEFDVPDKKMITLEQLLTHRAGLPPELSLAPCAQGRAACVQFLARQPLAYAPGTSYIYTCQGFFLLQMVIEKILGTTLDVAARTLIFEPLHMHDTCFCPGAAVIERCAPCDHAAGVLLRGIVHDPAARALGGVSGNAGVFSTAADVAIFCQMMLNEGEYHGVRILNRETVQCMTSAGATPPACARGLGWEINSPRAFVARGDVFSVGTSYGHTGFTGVSLWLDPTTQTFVIFLSNRLHPDGKGDLKDVRSKVATIVAASIMK